MIKVKGGIRQIYLGRVGENNVVTIQFDYSEWLEEFGAGTVALVLKRANDTEAFPVVISQQNGIATWVVTSAHTAQEGKGYCELSYTVNDKIAKSLIWQTVTKPALIVGATPPQPWVQWINVITEAASHYPKLSETNTWLLWDVASSQWVDTGISGVGPAGPQGPTGPTGATGPQGPQGPTGPTGTTFTPSVSAEGIISWTNDGGKTNPEAVDIKGPRGNTGSKGDTGTTYTPNVSDQGVISWSNDGGKPNPNPVNIKGPQGATGPQGETGATGPQGPTGATGPQGPAGAQGAQGPKGDTGEKGDKGDTGAQGPKGDTGATGPQGQPGATGQQGPKGDTGSQGPVGPTGPQGETGATGAQGPKGDKGDTGATGPAGQDGLTTSITMNGETKTQVSGNINLGIVLTQHQSLSAYRTASAQDLIDLGITNDIDAIEAKIPTQASSSNQLADKAFVNSSIATNTATFRGTSASGLTEAQFLAWANTLTHDDNDYVFWNTTDSDGNVIYKRYKYNGTEWLFEYALNNSSFTSAQWNAINSGITSDKVAEITANTNARHTHSNSSVLNAITQAFVDAWNTASTWVSTNGANVISHLSNTIVHITSEERTAWNAKQNESDLSLQTTNKHIVPAINEVKETADSKSVVSVSASGTATDEVGYITVNGVEKKLAGGGGAVDSVNGKTGTVVLDAEDVGALPDDTPIPSKTSDITNDSGFITNAVNDLVNYTKTSDLAEVATSGDYDDLSNTPDVYTKTEADALLINKQDKTSNLLNTTSKEVVGAINEVNTAVGNKVDKVNGKGLSTNDYDNTEKQKVADAYNDKHTHNNMSILNNIGSDANGLYWED